VDLKEWFSNNWKHIFILLLIFLVAFGFRAHILRYDLLFEFDTYWHTRMDGYLIQTGQLPDEDYIGTYHDAEKGLQQERYALFWGAGALIYKIVYFGAAYDLEKMLALVRVLPALYGALTALAVYLLFRWAYKSRKIGYIAGFVTAVMPGYIYRTMGGFYEEDSFGFLWMALGFAFLVRAVRDPLFTKENAIYSALAGICFGIMAWSWKVFFIVPVILEAYAIVTLLWNWFRGLDKKQLMALAGLFAICFVITAGIATWAYGSEWFDYQVNYAKGFLGIEGGKQVYNASSGVGEENSGYQFFGTKYGVFNIFVVLGVIAAIYGLYRKKNDFTTFLFLFWGLGTFYLAWNKLKATYWFGLGLSILTALALAEIYIYISNLEDKKQTAIKVATVTVCLLLLAGGVASGVIFTHSHVPNIISDDGWKDTVFWMRDNIPEYSKSFNWWNWGHWITTIGNLRASSDNTNFDGQANRDFSMFVIDTNLQSALGIIKAYDADYVVLSSEDIANQMVYATYAYKVGSSDYRVSSHFGIVMPCRKSSNPVTNLIEYNCGGNKIGEKQMAGFATNWQSKPNDLYSGKIPIFYYTNSQKNQLWMINNVNNDSIGAKLWFNSIETQKYFELVYDNGYQKIFKVNKDQFKDVQMHMVDMNLQQIEEWNSKLWWLDQNTPTPIKPN